MLEGINFAKDYQKESYNKTKLMGILKKNKDLLTTFKNHSNPKICQILKL
jgi:hypothetical protein